MNEQKLKISVIIPVYNGERWVAQCIDNVLKQSYKNLEVIVVDDGSTDSSGAIAARYPVKVITQPNGGLSVARNAGMEAATGDYIHFMDVDDLINLQYYEHMAAAVELTGSDIACGGMVCHRVKHSTMRFDEQLLLTDPNDKLFMTIAGLCETACCYITRRTFLLEHSLGFEPGRFFEDVSFILEAFYAANHIVTVPGALYHYMYRAGSITTTVSTGARKKKIEEHSAFARKYRREFLGRHGLRTAGAQQTEYAEYKILGIPMLKKISTDDGRTRWYLWGIRLVRKKRLGVDAV